MDLGQTRVTNANLAGAGLNKLRWLSLSNCHLSDAGAKHLAQLTHLEHLDLSNTPVTAAHLAALKTSLPQCRIVTTAASQQLASP
jgi:Leucine-rich repeat (LRR) protein